MSVDRAKEFLKKLRTDKELTSKVKEAYTEGIRRVAGESGFDFSAEDLGKAIRELEEQLSGELSDEDIDAAAGGTGNVGYVNLGMANIDPRRL